MRIITLVLLFSMLSCATISRADTRSIPTVEEFQLPRYLGTWYEIARLPHRFERNLQQVTATYTLLDNGKIEVLNRGFNTKKQKWSEARGTAWVPSLDAPSELRVRFFWPFSAAYRIIWLDADYTLALVTSNSFSYFWMLSRTPQIPQQTYDQLISHAAQWGFDTAGIIKVVQ